MPSAGRQLWHTRRGTSKSIMSSDPSRASPQEKKPARPGCKPSPQELPRHQASLLRAAACMRLKPCTGQAGSPSGEAAGASAGLVPMVRGFKLSHGGAKKVRTRPVREGAAAAVQGCYAAAEPYW